MFKNVIPLLFQNCCTVLRIGSLWLKGISEHSVWFKLVLLSAQSSSNQLNPPWQGLYENRLVVRPLLISVSKSRPSYTAWKNCKWWVGMYNLHSTYYSNINATIKLMMAFEILRSSIRLQTWFDPIACLVEGAMFTYVYKKFADLFFSYNRPMQTWEHKQI